MSNYFSKVPNLEYVSRLPDANISDYIPVKNLFKRGHEWLEAEEKGVARAAEEGTHQQMENRAGATFRKYEETKRWNQKALRENKELKQFFEQFARKNLVSLEKRVKWKDWCDSRPVVRLGGLQEKYDVIW